MKNKKVTTTLVAGALALTSVIGMGAAAFGADGQGSGPQSGKAPTAEQIAEHQAQRQAKLEKKLTKAVEDGKITEAQKTEILEFFEDNKPSVDKDATREERKAAMDAFKEKVEAFAEENDIDLDVLKPAGRPGGPGRPGGHGNHGGPQAEN